MALNSGMAHTGLNAVHGLFIGRVAVADGDEHVRLGGDAADGLHIALFLGRDGEHAHDVGVLLQEFHVEGFDIGLVLRALLGHADERALGVHAQDGRALGVHARLHGLADGGEGLAQRVVGDGHRGGQPAGHAVFGQTLGHGDQLAHLAVGRVVA